MGHGKAVQLLGQERGQEGGIWSHVLLILPSPKALGQPLSVPVPLFCTEIHMSIKAHWGPIPFSVWCLVW